jgi:hypothetical protein
MEEVQGRVEMKYCEPCGALWLRAIGSRDIYCCQCKWQMRELPLAGYQKAGMRRRKADSTELSILHASSAFALSNYGGAL